MRLWAGLISTFLLAPGKVFGQGTVTVLNTDVIGPLPATAQFGRVESPVPSLATGAVNFPVDLFRINVGEVSIPLSLCYSTQGIKVYYPDLG